MLRSAQGLAWSGSRAVATLGPVSVLRTLFGRILRKVAKVEERRRKRLRHNALLLAIAIAVPPAAAPQAAFNAAPIQAPPPHETFDYSIEWRLINAGKAHLEWSSSASGGAETGGTTSGDVRLHVESAGLVSRLFLVNDEYSSSLGTGFCAQSTLLEAEEGGRHKETRVTYDAAAHKASYLEKDFIKNSTVSQEVAIPSCVHDLIGGLVALRFLRLDPGKAAQIPVSDGKKFVMAKVESQRREVLKTEFGPVNTVLYEIYLFDNILFRRSGHLHVWFTDDDRRLPIQLQVRLQFAIGTITFRLEKPPAADDAVPGGK
jgi:hypothetical protein